MASSNGHGRRQHHDAERERETGAFAVGRQGSNPEPMGKKQPGPVLRALCLHGCQGQWRLLRACTGSAGEPCHDPCHELPRLPAHADYVT